MTPFNPVDYRSCLAAIPTPAQESAWQEHIPFAMVLVEMLRPRVLVELGVHTGGSYLAFCQAVAALGLPCVCYGVDTFQGDEHSGGYGRNIEMELRLRHDPLYGGFSRLITSTFDEAAEQISDGRVDLLHIDGFHTYEAAAHDFATWSPKLSERAVVLFHDINVRERGFGVWRLWEELSAQHRHFTFAHGHGLGVLAVGKDIPPELAQFLALEGEAAARVCELFFLLGNRLTMQVDSEMLKKELDRTVRKLLATEGYLTAAQADRARCEVALAKLHEDAEALKGELRRLHDSVSFRLGVGATAPLRWVAGKLGSPRARE